MPEQQKPPFNPDMIVDAVLVPDPVSQDLVPATRPPEVIDVDEVVDAGDYAPRHDPTPHFSPDISAHDRDANAATMAERRDARAAQFARERDASAAAQTAARDARIGAGVPPVDHSWATTPRSPEELRRAYAEGGPIHASAVVRTVGSVAVGTPPPSPPAPQSAPYRMDIDVI